MKIRSFFLLLIILWCFISQADSVGAQGNPIIFLNETSHAFPTVFEGEKLSHTFTIFNKGKADLNIKKVTHTWGCSAARYDRVVPPGGKGEITVEIDSNSVRGKFEKKVIIWTNDLERRSVALYLTGEVKPHIALEPGSYLSLWGDKDQVVKDHLEIINNHEKAIKILSIDTDLTDQIRWHLKEITPGFHYRLEVEDISKAGKEYTGHLFIKTDNPQKPELSIIVNRH